MAYLILALAAAGSIAGPGVAGVFSVDLQGNVREELTPPQAVVAAFDVVSGVVAGVAGMLIAVLATWVQPEHGVPQLQLAGGLLAPIAPGTVWFCLVRPGSPAIIG